MERLSGMDASFPHMKTPDIHLQVVGTAVLDPSTMCSFFDSIKQTLSDRIHLLPPFRHRVVNVPFQLSHPVWVEDPNFDLDAHVRRIGTPAPGSLHELAEVVGDIASRPLDRSVEGFEHGHVAIVTIPLSTASPARTSWETSSTSHRR